MGNNVEKFDTEYTTESGEVVASDATIVHLEDQQTEAEHQENLELMGTLTERYDELQAKMVQIQADEAAGKGPFPEEISTIQNEINQIEEQRAQLESVTKEAA